MQLLPPVMTRTRYLFNASGRDKMSLLDPSATDAQGTDMAIRKRKLLRSMHVDLFLTNKKRKTTASKRVRFATTDSVQLIDTTESEPKQTWYDNVDYDRFQKEGRNTITALSKTKGNHKILDHNKYCLRGFEDHISLKHLELKRQRLRSCTKSVLNNSRLQRQLGVKNDNSLMMISQIYSKSSLSLALERGTLHASIDENTLL
jgi:hypothetical protein